MLNWLLGVNYKRRPPFSKWVVAIIERTGLALSVNEMYNLSELWRWPADGGQIQRVIQIIGKWHRIFMAKKKRQQPRYFSNMLLPSSRKSITHRRKSQAMEKLTWTFIIYLCWETLLMPLSWHVVCNSDICILFFFYKPNCLQLN